MTCNISCNPSLGCAQFIVQQVDSLSSVHMLASALPCYQRQAAGTFHLGSPDSLVPQAACSSPGLQKSKAPGQLSLFCKVFRQSSDISQTGGRKLCQFYPLSLSLSLADSSSSCRFQSPSCPYHQPFYPPASPLVPWPVPLWEAMLLVQDS